MQFQFINDYTVLFVHWVYSGNTAEYIAFTVLWRESIQKTNSSNIFCSGIKLVLWLTRPDGRLSIFVWRVSGVWYVYVLKLLKFLSVNGRIY